MGSFSDYGTLQTTLATLFNRDDVTALVTTFIELAEDDLSGDIDHPRMIYRSTFTADVQIPIPADYQRTSNMDAVAIGPVSFVSLSDFDAFNEGGAQGYYYTIIGDQFYFSSLLVGTEIVHTYRRRLPALSVYNVTNWILTTYPSAYLYAAAKHIAVYLIEDDRVPGFEALYQAALGRINKNGVEMATPVFTKLIKRKVV